MFYSYRGEGRFGWLTDAEWEKKQEYVPDANVICTFFRHQNPDLNITATDAVLPDSDVLLRRIVFQNMGLNDVFVRFFYYNDLAIFESPIDDAAYYLQGRDAIVHYKRDVYFAYGGTVRSTGHQCGVHGEGSDAFSDVYDSILSGGSLTLYDGSRDVNSCLCWDVGNIKSKDTKTLTVIMALGPTEKEVLEELEKCRKEPLDEQISKIEDFWKKWIATFKLSSAQEALSGIAKRSLLTLKLLTSERQGGIIAAPCMEPEYRFCWPRDATYVAYAFDKCGFHEEAKRFYKWCAKAQEPEGGLYQRYYIGARLKGPCWSSQIDETATVLWGMGKHYELTSDYRFIQSIWHMIRRAADFLQEEVAKANGLVESVGLWEEKFGGHTYSNAAIYSGLKTAANIAKIVDQNALSEKWDEAAESIKGSLLKLAWDADLNHFITTVAPRNQNLDASLLSLVYPFEVLPASDERMRKTATAIEAAFSYKVGGIGRYPLDQYYGGNPWILTTLWLALYYEKLGDLGKVKQLIHWALDHSTELGLLSEQIDKTNGSPVSAIPLAWSHAFLVLAIKDLENNEETV